MKAVEQIKCLTSHFFEEFKMENTQRFQEEERIKEKEKEEIDAFRRKQQEELLKGRADHFNALTLLLAGKKVAIIPKNSLNVKKGVKKFTWNEGHTTRTVKNVQPSSLVISETPKSKHAGAPITLPALKTHKNLGSSQIMTKDFEAKSRAQKLRITK